MGRPECYPGHIPAGNPWGNLVASHFLIVVYVFFVDCIKSQ